MTRRSLHDDGVARVLRDHYETEAADAGLRSIDLSGAGGGRSSASPDTAMIARVHRQAEHRRARAALALLPKHLRDALALAYGCSPREHDGDAGKAPRRRGKGPPRGDERGWRTRLRERLPGLGALAAAIVLSPTIRRSFDVSARPEGIGEWLASNASSALLAAAERETILLLEEATAAFARAYEPPPGVPRLDAEPPRKTRKIDKEEVRRRIEAEEARWR